MIDGRAVDQGARICVVADDADYRVAAAELPASVRLVDEADGAIVVIAGDAPVRAGSAPVAVLLADPPGRDAEAAGAGGRWAVARLREDAVAALAPGTALVAGLGDPRSRLADMPAAHAEACRAARAAAVDPALAPLAAWEEIGVHRLLPADPGEAELATAATLLDRLRAGRDGAALAQTLETYLDLAAGAQATAAALHLHRTSLYHRLGRIEQLTGRDLRDGRDRLELHLALKLARAARAPAL
jgi:hypothetical protein